MDTARVLDRLPDGTIKQVSSLTGTVVWTVPGRSHRPLPSPLPPARPLEGADRTRTCAFCPARYRETPPEKSRLLLGPAGTGPAGWRVLENVAAEHLDDSVADFRRIPNLFEILPFDYWHANHGYELPRAAATRADAYATSPQGREHLLALARTRMRAAGATDARVAAEPQERLIAASRTLFASAHDVIVARRHFIDGARSDDELAGAGDLTPDEHHAYLAFTVTALADLARHPFARYVAVFQNWLRPAGASFDHLHKQLVAIDEHGPLMTRIEAAARADPDLFNRALADPAAEDRLVIAENDDALAVAGVGHRYPTVEVLATGAAPRPWDADAAAVRGVSDLLHACHAATGRLVPSNEEWHYRPHDVAVAMPWRVNLKWRVSTLAGFEGGTKVNVNTISPFALRDRMVGALFDLRRDGRIAGLAIGDECSHRHSALRYARG